MSLKFLFDQNIPRRLVRLLDGNFPGSIHVLDVGLGRSSDRAIWDFAAANGFAIVSKDADFHHMSFLYGAPPKTIWVKLGNCTTAQIADCLLGQTHVLHAFLLDEEAALLVVGDS